MTKNEQTVVEYLQREVFKARTELAEANERLEFERGCIDDARRRLGDVTALLIGTRADKIDCIASVIDDAGRYLMKRFEDRS